MGRINTVPGHDNFYSLSKVSSKLKGYYFFGEADKDGKMEAADNGINVLATEKMLENLREASMQVVKVDKAKLDEIIELSNKIADVATTFDNAAKEKSRYLKVFKDMVNVSDGFFKKYGATLSKSSSLQYSVTYMIIGGLNICLIEMAGILSEAIVAMTKHSGVTIDSYIESTPRYKDTFIMMHEKILANVKNLAPLLTEGIKESVDMSDVSPITTTIAMNGGMDIYGEAGVSVFRVMKALLFRVMYAVLAPIRYMIYLFLLAGFSVSERFGQIRDTIAIYDTKNPMSVQEKESKLNDLENRGIKARLSRVEADSKIYKKIESEKEDISKSVTSASNKASVDAIF